jgi:AcrR family transcriptional regulator
MALSERVDAQRNRTRLVAAARALLARDGVGMSSREVAREAGVGVATLYRHFPTREDLVDALLEELFEQVVAAGERALAEEDAWAGFARFLEQVLALNAGNRGLKDVMETMQHGRERAASMRRRIRPLVAELIDRAQAQGTLRPDFTPNDLSLLVWGGDRVVELTADVAPGVWRRHLGLVLDGLRVAAATPLPHAPLTDAQLRKVGA